jgi:hypothetical protein
MTNKSINVLKDTQMVNPVIDQLNPETFEVTAKKHQPAPEKKLVQLRRGSRGTNDSRPTGYAPGLVVSSHSIAVDLCITKLDSIELNSKRSN